MTSLAYLLLFTLLAGGLVSTVRREYGVGTQHKSRENLSQNAATLSGRWDQRSLRGDAGPSAHPEQVHIALGDARSRELYAMSVSWLTWVDAKSGVLWGQDTHVLEEVVLGNATRYTTSHTNLSLPDVTSGLLHSAVIGGLEPSTTYFYRVGDEELGLSDVRTFTTPGAVGAEQPLILGILGDLGQTNDSRNTLDAILQHQPAIDVVLHAGDLSYADCEEDRWDSFMTMLDPAASSIPWMVAAGNHEIEARNTDGSGPFAAYENRFRMPSVATAVRGYECGLAGGLDGNRTACGPGLNDLSILPDGDDDDDGVGGDSNGGLGRGVAKAALLAKEAISSFGGGVVSTNWPDDEGDGGDGGEEEEEDEERQDDQVEEQAQPKCCPSEWSGTYDYGNSFYSFDVASVHVVVLNPYTATGVGSVQHSWLVEDLDACDRSLTPWVVAMFHCPWHNSNIKHPSERMAVTAMRAMEPVLFQHKASLVISGHVHAYERSLPVLSGQLHDQGLVNLVVGGAGNIEGADSEYYRVPEWSAFRNGSVFGFGTLSVINSTMAFWEWKSNKGEPVVHDSAWISNKFLVGPNPG
ncbi:unnamed protein product [Scytosiphon promiscuus]